MPRRTDGRRANGGARPDAGRPWVRVALDGETRDRIRALTVARGWGKGEAAAARLVAEWAAREWAEYDAEISRAAVSAAEWGGERYGSEW